MIFNKYKIILQNLMLILCTSLLSGCESAVLNPKGQIALQQRSLILIAFCLMLIVVIPAIVMTILFAWKYRESNINATYSPDWSHSNKIEIIVWTVPIIIVLFLSVLSWKSTHELEPSKPIVSTIKPIEIDVIALDWKWLFIYPKQNLATINQIAFPVNTPINFKITSNSVMNSFFIPQLGSQIYAMAGMETKLNLIANEPGVYNGISANFSGPGFSDMKFKTIVTKNNEDFAKWITKVKKSNNKLDNMNIFESIALPSENNPVKYFSVIDPDLFLHVIDKFKMNHTMNMKH
ncbi:ubiquinol oxidase subunit II [Candidatus Pantoea edessiphila]|uniref:Ubiquinol oxidase subunit 2 n=1 Tax=Candidatus Pantoea edessiphila TaxID=2044610 RepID=A0A2P5SVJ2_9GAMM|nr:ubiquinol oxidase subunit II [Candidatus Pantoea edessiphila]PPI86332.1 ubiquinol oxidase subunit II [Candidatus Pantoea edessiphila]